MALSCWVGCEDATELSTISLSNIGPWHCFRGHGAVYEFDICSGLISKSYLEIKPDLCWQDIKGFSLCEFPCITPCVWLG